MSAPASARATASVQSDAATAAGYQGQLAIESEAIQNAHRKGSLGNSPPRINYRQ